jgi:hypothetical protein
MSTNVPVDLYFLIRKVSDDADAAPLLNEEIPEKYGKINKPEIFKCYARLTHKLNPNDFDHDIRSNIDYEKDLIEDTVSQNNNLEIDTDSPTTPEEQEKLDRFKKHVYQKHFFKGQRSGERGVRGGPVAISDEDAEKLRGMTAEDPELDYFNDLGKHLYVHHGWGLGDFQNHPTTKDREIAHEIEHNPVIGDTQAQGTTYFDELAQPFANGNRVPVLGKPAPNMLDAHLRLLHGMDGGTEEDHIKHHHSGKVTNHTHDANDLQLP